MLFRSFVVVPRIEDMAAIGEMLASLVPELEILQAHGKMPADAIDDAMVRFGRDPAVGSSVMITACTDSGGFFIFLGLATLFLL